MKEDEEEEERSDDNDRQQRRARFPNLGRDSQKRIKEGEVQERSGSHVQLYASVPIITRGRERLCVWSRPEVVVVEEMRKREDEARWRRREEEQGSVCAWKYIPHTQAGCKKNRELSSALDRQGELGFFFSPR